MMIREKIFDTGVVRINYAEGPVSGPPLVLLHGGGDRWQTFLPIIPSLIVKWHVFALDLRGHGKSGRVPGKYRPEHYVEDIVLFLKRQLDEQGILFGSSLGGWIALLAAAQKKEKVNALILGDPPLDLDRFLSIESSEEKMVVWRKMRELAASGLTQSELASALADSPLSGEARLQAKTFSQVDPDVIQYHAEGRLHEYIEKVDLEGALQQLSCPVLLVQGDPSQGAWVSEEDVKRVLALLADGVFVRLEEKGHDLGISTWEVAPLLRAIHGFLESL